MKKYKKIILLTLVPSISFLGLPFVASSCDDATNVLNNIASKVNFNIENKTTKIASEIKKEDIKISNFDETKYEASILNLTPSGDTLKVKYQLKDKKTGKTSREYETTITGFKSSQNMPLDDIAKKVTFDVKDKTTKESKDIKETDLITNNLDKEKYEVVIKNLLASNKTLKVKYQLKEKSTGKLSNEFEYEITGFKSSEIVEPNEEVKKLTDFAKTLTTKYDSDLNSKDANELETSKISLLNNNQPLSSEYSVEELKFINEPATEDEINNGIRQISFKLKKGNLVSNSITANISTHKTNKKNILDLREKTKTLFNLSNTAKAKEILDSLEDGSILNVDYKTGTVSNKPYNDPDRTTLFTYNKNEIPFGTSFASENNLSKFNEVNNKVKLVKKNGKYALKFYLAKYDFKHPENRRIDYKETETNEMQSSSLTISELNKLIDNLNDSSFKYENAENTLVKEAKKEKISLVNPISNVNLSIKSLTPDLIKSELNFVATLTYTDENGAIIESKSKSFKITGFKVDDLKSEFDNISLEYKSGDKSSILPSSVKESDIKILKNSQEHTFTNGVTSKIEIISKNDTTGEVIAKLTLIKDGKSSSANYTITGFKKKDFNLDELITRITVETSSAIDKNNTLASTINESNIEVIDPQNQLDKVDVTKQIVSYDNQTGTLKIKVTIKDKSSSETKEKEFEINGFKTEEGLESMYEALKKAAKENKLFKKLTEDEIKQIEEEYKKLKNKTKGLYLATSTWSYGSSSKNAKKSDAPKINPHFLDEKFNNSPKYMDLIKKHLLNSEFKTKGIKAVYITKTSEGKYVIKFKFVHVTIGTELNSKKDKGSATETEEFTWELN